jgi:hypothetical protein
MQLSTKNKVRRLVGASLIATFAMGGLVVGPATADEGVGPPGGPAPVPSLPQIPPGDEGRPEGPPQIPVPVPVPGGGA